MRTQLIRRDEQRLQRWRNGDGVTREIAVHPPQADYESFQWRISCAEFSQDCPFSSFPGVTRTLCVLRGEFLLQLDQAEHVRLGPSSAPHVFDGGRAAFATIIQAPVCDLNVMTRRDVRATVRSEQGPGVPRRLAVTAGTTLIYSAGVCEITRPPAAPLALGAGDAALWHADADGELTYQAAAGARILVVGLAGHQC